MRTLSAHGPRKRAGLVGGAGDDEGGAGVGAGEVGEDPPGRLEDPAALVGERVEHDDRQLERLEPLGDRAGLAVERGEHQVGRGVGGHGGRR